MAFVKDLALRLARSIWNKRGYWTRALFAGLIGLVALHFDSQGDYDLRFQIRGPQLADSEIVLLEFSPSEMRQWSARTLQLMRKYPEMSLVNDNAFWDYRLWTQILRKVLSYNPQKVGVALHFETSQNSRWMIPEHKLLFEDPKLFWTTQVDIEGNPLPSITAKRAQLTLANFNADPDGVFRRQSESASALAGLAEILADQALPSTQTTFFKPSTFINFRGPQGTYAHFGLDDLLTDAIAPQALAGKIIIVGATQTPLQMMLTPLGPMPRAEVVATTVDNLRNQNGLKKFPTWFYCLFLIAVLAISVLVTCYSPGSIAFALLLWLSTALAATSIWIFDAYGLWLPIVSPLVMTALVFVVFVNYRLTLRERLHWKLSHEARNVQELEQLKSNFISLFSHDLKTPIAKIQAVIDRLLAQSNGENLHGEFLYSDLQSLRQTSNELHSYIQKILQVTQVESRKLKMAHEVVDINEVIENVIVQLQPLAREKNVDLASDLEPIFSIEADPTLLHEVILNLVDNAIKYTPSGGKVLIQSSEQDEFIKVVVKDTGDGISEDEQRHIWRKFVRGRQHDLQIKGTGLGLYLTKYFIELHGGEVFLTSQPGKGTEVGFTLPIEPLQHQHMTSASQDLRASPGTKVGWL